MENTGFITGSVFFYLIALQNEEDYERESWGGGGGIK